MTSFSISTDWKVDSYDTIFIIVDCFTKIVYHESVKSMMNAAGLVKDIIDVVIRYYGFLESIVSDKSSPFISKFCFLLYYFLKIK